MTTVEDTLRDLSKYLDGLTSILPGESWNTVISEFIRTGVEVSYVRSAGFRTNDLNSPASWLQRHSTRSVRFFRVLSIVASRERIPKSCQMSLRAISNSYSSSSSTTKSNLFSLNRMQRTEEGLPRFACAERDARGSNHVY